MYSTVPAQHHVWCTGINAIKRNDRRSKNLYETFLSAYFVEACF